MPELQVRKSMITLLDRLRRMIGDAPMPQEWTDIDLQDALDAYQKQARYLPLRCEGTRPPGGGFILYLDYYADQGDWEENALLFDASYNDISLNFTPDYRTGHWSLTQTANWPVYVTGRHYDLYGAAADALEMWAARLTEAYDFSAQGTSYKRSQMVDAKLKLAVKYREKQQIATVDMARGDVDRRRS